MYKGLSFYGKLVSFILLVISMVIIKNYNIFLLICGMIFIVSFLNKNKILFFISLLLFLVTYLVPYNLPTFIALRVCLVILYALIIESSLLSLEKRYLYDKLFYRNRTTKQLKRYMRRYYYKDIINEIDDYNESVNKYLFEKDKYKKFLKEEAEKKAEVRIDDLYLLDKMRFDRFFTNKKSKLSFSWNNYDNFYIAVTLLFFVIVIVFGM